MRNIVEDLIRDASKTLTKLTKVRCVESYSLPDTVKSKNIFSWPNTRFLDSELFSFLEKNNVCLQNNHVKTFSVPYDMYDKMTKIDSQSIEEIKKTRILLDVFQIVFSGKPVLEITAIWDTVEDPNRIPPRTMSDVQGLREFSACKGSFLVFRREDELYDIKLRPLAYDVLLRHKPELSSFDISMGDIRMFVSDKVDEKARKNRNIVFEAHKAHLDAVMRQTSGAIEKMIGSPDLVRAVKNIV